MNEYCVSDVNSFQIGSSNNFIDIEENELNDSHDDELDRTRGAQDNTESDKNSSSGKFCIEQGCNVDINPRPVRPTICIIKSFGYSPFIVATIILTEIIVRVEEPSDQDCPLNAEGRNHHVQGHSRESVPLQEGVEETNTKEDHDMDILEHWDKVDLGLENIPL